MNPNTATEYRNLPLNVLTESTTNPRRIFEDVALKELPSQFESRAFYLPCSSVLLTGQSFEIVAGARRYAPRRSPRPQPFPSASSTSQMPKRWRPLWSKISSERDVHPMEEAQWFSCASKFGGTEVHHRANRREGWQGTRRTSPHAPD
jgi:ParB family chromosome partitioning protein